MKIANRIHIIAVHCSTCGPSDSKKREPKAYTNATIYVKKLEAGENPQDVSLIEKDSGSSVESKETPRKRKCDGDDGQDVECNGEKTCKLDSGPVRRSRRSRKMDGDVIFKVNACDTLQDLMLQVN